MKAHPAQTSGVCPLCKDIIIPGQMVEIRSGRRIHASCSSNRSRVPRALRSAFQRRETAEERAKAYWDKVQREFEAKRAQAQR